MNTLILGIHGSDLKIVDFFEKIIPSNRTA